MRIRVDFDAGSEAQLTDEQADGAEPTRESSWHRLAGSTSQTPFLSTAVPLTFDSTGIPASETVNVTVAFVGPVTVTLLTVAEVFVASGF